jgi:hypothetical protein
VYPTLLTYEQYEALPGDKQVAYARSFPSLVAFNEWRTEARRIWEEAQDKVVIGPGGEIELN